MSRRTPQDSLAIDRRPFYHPTRTLITELRDEMRAGLQALSDGLLRNPMVTITGKDGSADVSSVGRAR
jgi:hypothetical protein